jgi:predicted permease
MFTELINRLSYLLRRDGTESGINAEIQFHLESRADELQAKGLTREAAISQARREFGPGGRVTDEVRSAWQVRWLEDLLSDLRYAARTFRRNPAFAFTAIACLALGIGANTTIFSIATEVLFSRPSVRDPATIVNIEVGGSSNASQRNYRFLHDAGVFEDLAGQNAEVETNWRNGAATRRLFAVRVTDNFFDFTGVPVLLGRLFRAGETDGVVVSYGLWQREFAGEPGVIGRAMVLDGRVYRISAVLPRDHRNIMGFGLSPDIYYPSDETTTVQLYARLAPGMTRGVAFQRLLAAARELDRVYPEGSFRWSDGVRVIPISGWARIQETNQVMPVAAFFVVLMLVVALVLLIACANVASLLLARASSRSHELAVRLSIGAGRGRLIRQLLAESLLLAMCGTAAGLALNISLTTLLSRLRLTLPVPIQYLITPDWRLLAYSAAVALGTGLIAGLLPAMRATAWCVSPVLKRELPESRGRWSLCNGLVVGQLAVSVVLLCAGFLFLRNLISASTIQPGFDIDHTVWSYMRLVPESYTSQDKTHALVAAALEQLRSLPGVESASIARIVPLNDNLTNGTSVRTDLSDQPVHVTLKTNYVAPDYFRTMDIAVVQGRDFTASDRRNAPGVAIINENAAHRLFGDMSPVGHTVHWLGREPVSIVGVARNSKYFTLGENGTLAWYAPYEQMNGVYPRLHFLVRSYGRPEPLVKSIDAVLDRLDPTAAIETKPMSNALIFALLPSRFGAAILSSVGLLGLALASIGLYGALSYSVSRRVREIGLRVALGATPTGVLVLVIRQSAALAATGIATGLVLGIFAVRPLALFLTPEVSPTDPSTFVSVAVTLFSVALVATVSPALRALRIDPMAALREE